MTRLGQGQIGFQKRRLGVQQVVDRAAAQLIVRALDGESLTRLFYTLEGDPLPVARFGQSSRFLADFFRDFQGARPFSLPRFVLEALGLAPSGLDLSASPQREL